MEIEQHAKEAAAARLRELTLPDHLVRLDSIRHEAVQRRAALEAQLVLLFR